MIKPVSFRIDEEVKRKLLILSSHNLISNAEQLKNMINKEFEKLPADYKKKLNT